MAKKKSKLPLILAVLLVVIIAVFGGYIGYQYVQSDINGVRGNETSYTLEITANDFEYEIGKKLADNNIIKSDTVWANWMSKHYPDFVFINGEYNLNSYMSYEEIAKKLQEPDVSHKGVKVCIPEGTNCMEIAKLLEENGVCKASDFLESCKKKPTLDFDWVKTIPDSDMVAYKVEGFLFPATYDLPQNSDPQDVIDTMLETFDEHITDDMKGFCDEHNMTMFELVTLASVVQEEALGNKSAENIASVFINRINKGSKLQSDVTYFYARDLRDDYGFSQAVYDEYYTYRCKGLPAGPITNSGDEIMAATVHAPKTDYVYFFSDLKQDFHFASTYEEFEELKAKYPWE